MSIWFPLVLAAAVWCACDIKPLYGIVWGDNCPRYSLVETMII